MRKILLFLLCVPLVVACGKSDRMPESKETMLFDEITGLGAIGEYGKTISKSDSVLRLPISDSLRAYIMLERMVAMANMGNVSQAAAYADTVIEFGKKKGIDEVIINALTTKGVYYRRNALTDSALIYYQQALNLAVGGGNLEYEQYVCDILSILYTENSRDKEALQFSQRSFNLAREMKDTTAMISSIATIGAIYADEGKFRKILDVQTPYLGMVKEDMPGGYVVKFLTPVIKAYLELNILDSARYFIKKAEPAISQLPEHHQASVAILNAKAILFDKEHNYREELNIYNRIDSLGTSGKSANPLLYERAVCHNNLGDSHRAFLMMRDAYLALDSIRDRDIEMKMSEFSVKYETLQKEITIKQLEMQRLTWLVVSIILAASIIVIFLWIRYKHEKFIQRMALEKQTIYIHGLETERERIAKELHDGICNDLLAMTFTLTENEEAVAALSGLIAKVRDLSHELMPPKFKNSNLSQILTSYVIIMNNSCKNTDITITDEGQYDWEQLPAELSFELYRIVQESVSNALRHGLSTYIAVTLGGSGAHYSITIENDVAVTKSHADNVDSYEGIGMQTIKARAASIGADIEILQGENTYKIIIRG